MIYFDLDKEAYSQRETLEKWGKTYLTECSDEEYKELLDGKRRWQGDEIVLNPNYEEEKAMEAKSKKIETLKKQLEELDLKAVRALRAVIAGTSTDEDLRRLEALENEAREIRNEIVSL